MAYVNVTEHRVRVLAFVALAATVGGCSDDSTSSPVAPDAGVDVAVVDGSPDASPVLDVAVPDVGPDAPVDAGSDVVTDSAQVDNDVVDAGSDASPANDGSAGDAAGLDGDSSALPPLNMCDELNSGFPPIDDAGDYDPAGTWAQYMAQEYFSTIAGDCRVAGLVPTDPDSQQALLTKVGTFSVGFFGCSNSTPLPTFDELLPTTTPGTGFTNADVTAISQDFVSAVPNMMDDILADSLLPGQNAQIMARMAYVAAAWPGVTSSSTEYTYDQCGMDGGAESGTDDGGGTSSTDAMADGATDAGVSPEAAVDGMAGDGTTSEAGTD